MAREMTSTIEQGMVGPGTAVRPRDKRQRASRRGAIEGACQHLAGTSTERNLPWVV